MKSLIEQWNSLPMGKRRQLSTLHGIKDFGTTTEQLDFDLRTKLPVGTLKVEEVKELKKSKVETPKVEEVKIPIKKVKKKK